MSNSVSETLALVKDLINENNLEDALQHIEQIEKKENLTPEETLGILEKKGNVFYYLGNLDRSLKIVEDLYEKSQKMKMPLFSIDALWIKGWIFYRPTSYKDFYDIVKEGKKIFKLIPREETTKYLERKAKMLTMEGTREFNIGNLNLALDYYDKSLDLFEKTDPHSRFKSVILMGKAYAFQEKGELNLALEFNQKALSLIPEGENYSQLLLKASIYRSMGESYHQKGELEKALEYHILDHEILTKMKIPGGVSTLSLIIQVLLDKKDLTQARNYLQQFEEDSEKFDTEYMRTTYQFTRASFLKASSRMQDIFEAQIILKKIIEENPLDFLQNHPSSANLVLINLCDCYFEEFRLSNQIEVLDDIPPLIDLLQKNAKLQNSYSLLANVKLLQAKLALLQINMVEARKLLTEAQNIADEHSLQRLAIEISREHDHLLEELKLWESIKKEQASVAERLKLASVNTVLERMQGRRAIEPPEIISEEPILLIIMGKEGVSYFNYNFIQNWDFDDLFSAFMSAFNTFSSEIFSKSIDRIKIDENVILIRPIEPYLVCYVIKGQSYPAQKKLTRFSDSIRNNSEIWEALNKAAITNEMLDLSNPTSLGSTVKEIFIS